MNWISLFMEFFGVTREKNDRINKKNNWFQNSSCTQRLKKSTQTAMVIVTKKKQEKKNKWCLLGVIKSTFRGGWGRWMGKNELTIVG